MLTALHRLGQMLYPHRLRVLPAIILALMSFIGLLLLPLAAGQVLRNAASSLTLPFSLIILYIVAIGFMAIASYGAFTIMFEVANNIVAGLRTSCLSNLLGLPLQFHRDHKIGELLHRLDASLGDVEFFVKYTIVLLVGTVILGIGATVMLVLLSWKLTLLVLLTIAAGGVVLRPLFTRQREAQFQVERASGHVASYLLTVLLGIEMVKAFNTETHHVEGLERRQLEMKPLLRKGARYIALLEPIIITGAIGGVMFVLIVGSRLVADGEMSIDTLVTFLLYSFVLVPQSRTVGLLLMRWQHFRSALSYLDEILGLPPEIDYPGAIQLPQPVMGEIVFHHLTHQYADREFALRDVSIHIAPRECIGLVGASGAGKSTLMNLLLRFYEPGSGTISIDGVDIRRLTARSLRSNVAIVPQDTILFDDSIFENVRYGRLDASPEDVYTACRAAQAEGFINGLPDGYNTLVGERGVKLSGGQRQRIAIARALLKNAPILILDEATSSLDGNTERDLHTALSTLMEGRTTIVIAHRLSTLLGVSRLIVLDKGTIVGQGTQDELLERCSYYRSLFESQRFIS